MDQEANFKKFFFKIEIYPAHIEDHIYGPTVQMVFSRSADGKLWEPCGVIQMPALHSGGFCARLFKGEAAIGTEVIIERKT